MFIQCKTDLLALKLQSKHHRITNSIFYPFPGLSLCGNISAILSSEWLSGSYLPKARFCAGYLRDPPLRVAVYGRMAIRPLTRLKLCSYNLTVLRSQTNLTTFLSLRTTAFHRGTCILILFINKNMISTAFAVEIMFTLLWIDCHSKLLSYNTIR